jgi:hypothetical protein
MRFAGGAGDEDRRGEAIFALNMKYLHRFVPSGTRCRLDARRGEREAVPGANRPASERVARLGNGHSGGEK